MTESPFARRVWIEITPLLSISHLVYVTLRKKGVD